VLGTEPAPWGFSNQSDLVALADGRTVVVQRYFSRSAAEHRLRVMAAVAEPLRVAGVPIPALLLADLDATPPLAVFEAIPGKPSNVVAGEDLSGPIFVQIAEQMGSMLSIIGDLSTPGLPLPTLWSDPPLLAAEATRWLPIAMTWIESADVNMLRSMIASVPSLFRHRSPVFAHGDYGPQNVLIDGERITGLLDFEFARLADRLFDVAWWAWVVRFHTPDAFDRAWHPFLRAAGIDSTAAHFADRIQALQVLRILELIVDAEPRGEPAQEAWVDRLTATLRWVP
jgi:aminoglycoside phosphotransferase (APT) family kinase protein